MGRASKPEPIRAEGQVIPPDAPTEQQPGKPSFATALAVAITADLLQIVIFPLFSQGAFSPMDDVLDVAVGLGMVRLLGWHWAFLPSFLAKLVPFFDEFPCWTLAVLFVRAQRAKLQSA
jgi:hypothetical protein